LPRELKVLLKLLL